MAVVRIEDKHFNKVVYLYSLKADADQLASSLSSSADDRFIVAEHESRLGWVVKDTMSGRVYDAQGMVQ